MWLKDTQILTLSLKIKVDLKLWYMCIFMTRRSSRKYIQRISKVRNYVQQLRHHTFKRHLNMKEESYFAQTSL